LILKDKEKRSLSQRSKIIVADEYKPKVISPNRKKTKSVAGRSEIDPRLASKLSRGSNNGSDVLQHPPIRKKHRARSDIGARPADYQREKEESTLESFGLAWLIPQNFLKNF
jgi:hypothetical protein